MNLRPPILDERGLGKALEDQASAFGARTGIQCESDIQIDTRVDGEIETILYRIAQEALVNVGKHSHAEHVLIRCCARDGEVELEIRDDGVGFDPSKTDMTGLDGHLGLASIRERVGFAGGVCFIDSVVDGGTRVLIRLELERTGDEEAARIGS